MKTGFKDLDKIINLEDMRLILLTGTDFIEELSGDIANNVCLKQGYEVLEIVRCKKEYMIQRMFVNEANVNYRKWYGKNEYTEEEVKKIGQSTIKLLKNTKRLPTIIEQNVGLYDLKKVAELVLEYANYYAVREEVNILVILDVFPLGNELKDINKPKKYRKESLKLIKNLKKISNKLHCSIIFIDNIELTKKYNKKMSTWNYLTKANIDNISKINNYVDTFIIANASKTKDIEQKEIFNIDVYNKKQKIGKCKLMYDFNCRKFCDYK